MSQSAAPEEEPKQVNHPRYSGIQYATAIIRIVFAAKNPCRRFRAHISHVCFAPKYKTVKVLRQTNDASTKDSDMLVNKHTGRATSTHIQILPHWPIDHVTFKCVISSVVYIPRDTFWIEPLMCIPGARTFKSIRATRRDVDGGNWNIPTSPCDKGFRESVLKFWEKIFQLVCEWNARCLVWMKPGSECTTRQG